MFGTTTHPSAALQACALLHLHIALSRTPMVTPSSPLLHTEPAIVS